MWLYMKWRMLCIMKTSYRKQVSIGISGRIYGLLMANAITERRSYLRDYAFTSFHEFWAVSLEYFFEKPQGLKDNLPHLYAILCDSLNQDPLHLDELVLVG